MIGVEVFAEIDLFRRPLKVINPLGHSAWADWYEVVIASEEEKPERYFVKVSVGEHGGKALTGEFESTSEIHKVVSDFIPKPIAAGSFESIPGYHYYICKFYDLDQKLPEPAQFCRKLAKLHSKSQSPNGKFGFHIATYNGDVPQDNGYTDTWEEFFLKGFEHILRLNIERGGAWEEIEGLKPAIVSKVIPRLLRPLETGGRSIKPVLVHGDLWCGNAAVIADGGRPLIYDPSSFYAHNEYELGNWKPERNKFTSAYFEEYHSHIEKAEPQDDYDDRIALYSMRFNMHAAAMSPEDTTYRKLVTDEMKRLIIKYPRGYEEQGSGNDINSDTNCADSSSKGPT